MEMAVLVTWALGWPKQYMVDLQSGQALFQSLHQPSYPKPISNHMSDSLLHAYMPAVAVGALDNLRKAGKLQDYVTMQSRDCEST